MAPLAGDFIDTLNDKITYDDKSHECQDALKKSLQKKLGEKNIHSYSAQWHGSSVSKDHIETLPEELENCLKLSENSGAPSSLCLDVWRELSRVILSEAVPLEAKAKDILTNEITAHEDFGKDRARVFIGRTDILKSNADYINSNEPHPLAVWGASGSGKSALMAKAVEQAQEHGQKVIYRFIGATPESSNGRALLESLCKQISRRYGADGATIPSEYMDLVQEFPKRLALAKPDKPLVIFLDGLDQLSDADNAAA